MTPGGRQPLALGRFAAVAATVLVGALALQPANGRAAGFALVADPTPPSLPAGSTLAAVADVNGDGNPDLVIESRASDALGVMLGNGAGGFGPASSIALPLRPNSVRVADFNGDGHPDLLVAGETKSVERQPNPLPEAVMILSGDGSGGFSLGTPRALPEPGAVYAGDFTGNGLEDVLVAPTCEGEGDSGKLYMLLGDGHGALSPGPVTSAEPHSCFFDVGRFNGDARDDLVTFDPGRVGENGELLMFPGEPGGEFGTPVLTSAPPLAAALTAATADFDGNGTLDLVLERFTEPSSFYLMSGNGSGGFTPSPPYLSGAPHLFFTPALGDFSGDGHVDIAALGLEAVTVLENNGAGALSSVLSEPVPGEHNQAYVADVNRDGRPDLILSGFTQTSVLFDEPVTPIAPATAALALSNVRQSAPVWREREEPARSGRRLRVPRGTTFSFSLNEPARVRFAFSRQIAGRERAGRCHALAAAAAAHGRRCHLALAAGSLSLAAQRGGDSVAFAGRISRSRRLPAGRYSVTLTAAAGAVRSQPVTLRFTIVR